MPSKPVKTKSRSAPSVASKLAVMSYLDDMLHEATTLPEARPQDASESPETDWQDEALDRVTQTVTIAEPEPEPEPLEATVPVETSMPETEPGPPVWHKNGRPNWAQERFDCLVFSVNGLKLAVPLLLLGNIHPLEREMTPLFDQPAWFLGLLPVTGNRNIRVVDTAALVMPERYDPDQAEALEYAIGVHGSDWAFGAHAIEGSVSLVPDEVKWRTRRTSRPWLAGTVISEMCALIDMDAFAQILKG